MSVATVEPRASSQTATPASGNVALTIAVGALIAAAAFIVLFEFGAMLTPDLDTSAQIFLSP